MPFYVTTTTFNTSHLNIKTIGMTEGGNACSFTVLPEPDPNIKKAFEVRLRPAITGGGRKKEKGRIYQMTIHCATSTLRWLC